MKFTKKKFLQLNKFQQHKKCAEILRLLYEKILKKENFSNLFLHYQEILSWINLSFQKKSLKEIADQYHFHLKHSNCSLKEHNLLPNIKQKDKKTSKEPFLQNAIYLDNIRSAYNVGNIIRTLEALRIGSLYFSKCTPFKDNKKVEKTSMGASEMVPCKIESLENLPSPYIALETAEDGISIYEFLFPKKFTLILGNEEYGISDEILKKVDYIVTIPMLGIKNSINIASAFAMCAFQIKKQFHFEF